MKSKVFIYLFQPFIQIHSPVLCRYDNVILLKTILRVSSVLITSEFSMTRTIWECLKAKRSNKYKLLSVETKQFSAFNILTD